MSQISNTITKNKGVVILMAGLALLVVVGILTS